MTSLLAVFGADHRLLGGENGACIAQASAGGGSTADDVGSRPSGAPVVGAVSDGVDTSLAAECVASDGEIAVAADATFYHLTDLPHAVRAGLGPDATPASVVLAAYRVLGDGCVDYLEGDYAFVVWDARRGRMFCARDFSGRRPLHVAERGASLVVASRLATLAALPSFPAAIDDLTLGADAAGLMFALDDDCCMQGVRTIRAGWSASWTAGGGFRTQRTWHPAPGDTAALGFGDAAIELRRLLRESVAQRIAPDGPTAVWMSGGRDSTAVFAAGMSLPADLRRHGSLIPVSRTHPPGDSGREDEAIGEVAGMWGVTPNWVDAVDIPMLERPDRASAWQADSFAQPFEMLTRALAQATRQAGAAVAHDGFGGDFLFQVSAAYLADVVAGGRPAAALADWRAMRGGTGGMKELLRVGVLPLAPRWLRHAMSVVRGGRPLRLAMERAAPPWIDPAFVASHRLEARAEALGAQSAPGRSVVERETAFYLTHQFFARVNSAMAQFAAEEGVALRSPIMDRRVARFALSRPREERNSAGDQKRLLRAAMDGLLPASVLAPRRVKTGTLTTYFRTNMRSDGLARLRAIAVAPLLARHGIVDGPRFARAVALYAADPAAYPHEESLYCTLMAETWLRAQTDADRSSPRAATGKQGNNGKYRGHSGRTVAGHVVRL